MINSKARGLLFEFFRALELKKDGRLTFNF